MADRLVVLREGRVQQVGTPEELHNSPVNWHVADFMGYRNLLDMRVTARTAGLTTVEGHGVVLHGTAVDDVAVGDRVRVAIRPADLVVTSPTQPVTGDNRVEASVGVVEYHGREFAVSVLTGEGHMLHVHSDHAPTVGSRVELTADPQRVLVYRVELRDVEGLTQEERELEEVRR